MGTSTIQREPDQRTESGRAPTAPRLLRVLGELLLTFGVLLLFFVAYQFFGVPNQTSELQRQLTQQLHDTWRAEARHPAAGGQAQFVGQVTDGAPFATLALPKLGLQWTVVEGVSRSDLRKGPGHYPGTAMPGQLGNFAVAGHRERGIFLDLDHLANGDDVIVQTASSWFDYRIYQTEIVNPTDLAVIGPSPDVPGQAPTRPLLTLTTCDPRWSNYHRLIIHAQLVASRPS
jgi:sortase A